MTLFRSFLFFFFILFSPYSTIGQGLNLGAPPVSNFSTSDYEAATQNWDIAQGNEGIIYVANNSGMLEFDGFNWSIHAIGNGTIVRSVLLATDGKIYAGGQGDFGYFTPDPKGYLNYTSLTPQLPDSKVVFGDIWKIIETEAGIFFRTDRYVFHLRNGEIQTYPFDSPISFMGTLFDDIFVQNMEGQILEFDDDGFRPSKIPWDSEHRIFSSLTYHPDTVLLVTNQHGIHFSTKTGTGRWPTFSDDELMKGQLYCASMLPDGGFAIGTTNNGLYIFDRNRRTQHHINKKNGLQNNTVLDIFTDKAGDLWLGLDNGLDLVKISSPYTTIFPDGNLEGTGYAVEVFQDKLYFGTNTGLYSIPLKDQYSPTEKNNFQLIPGTEGQVWSLQALEGELLIGHHNGAYAIKGGRLRKLTDFLGVWRFISAGKGQAVAGCYEGVAQFAKKKGQWTFVKKYGGFQESSRLLAPAKDGGLWMAHPYRGVFRVNFLENDKLKVDFFGKEKGLPSDLNNLVFSMNQISLVAGKKGLFQFDPLQQEFRPSETFNEVFGADNRVSYLQQGKSGHVWYTIGDEVGVLLITDNAIEKKVERLAFPELAGRPMKGCEFIYPMDEDNIFLATVKGFVHFSLSDFPEKKASFQVVLHEVRQEANGNNILFGGHQSQGQIPVKPELSSSQNNIQFVLGATDHHGKEYLQFSHRMKEDAEWSDWTPNNSLIFNGLRHGDYTFQVKAKNRHGQESEVLSFPFKVFPPWYTSTLAKVVYWLILFGAFLFYMSFQRRNFENEKAELSISHQRIQSEHEEKVRRSEEIISQLEKEKLEAEVRFKNEELASTTMNLVQKNEFLSSIQEALEKLKEKDGLGAEEKKEIRRIVRLIEGDNSLQEDWVHFTRHFDQVHSDFLRRLGEEHPNLSPNDFKLSAYLRMNLSSKEIASLMNISVRGVEASRYRLRKRLGLSTETNLTEFLMKL